MRRGYPIVLEYPIYPVPRYGSGRPPNGSMAALIGHGYERYEARLRAMLKHVDKLAAIPIEPDSSKPEQPCWHNDWFSGFDALALYGLIESERPSRYWEIGSGNSTRFARRAVQDFGLQTEIVSIDPEPRIEIDGLCDAVVRQRLEDTDMERFARLDAGDMLFIDGSHYAFMNSDVTIVFMELLPRLKPGVLVHFHDIFWPDDYPLLWSAHYYNEQYMLAAYLLGRGEQADIVWPGCFVSQHPMLSALARPLWERLEGGTDLKMGGLGGSFWIRM